MTTSRNFIERRRNRGNRSHAKHRRHQLAVQDLPIESLHLDPLNPRDHSEEQIQQIAASIQTFGFNVPVLIDQNQNVIAGHGRLIASKLIGSTEVPTIALTHLSPHQIRAFMIADNRLTENSSWNETLLGEQLKALSEVELDFSLEATGFEMGEIDLLIEGLSPESSTDCDEADEVPESNSIPVTRLGDLYLLGRNRVYCGDCLEVLSYNLLMENRQAAVIFSDPPYNVRIAGHATGLGRIQHANFKMAAGEMSEAEFTNFLSRFCHLAVRNSCRGSIHFICIDWRHLPELLAAGREAYHELKNICVWTKTNAGMGSLYRSQHEFVCVFKNGTSAHRNNIELGEHGRYRTNVWSYPGANSFSRKTEEGNLLEFHPTVKPVALVADAIMDVSARGEMVLDSFLGSGTTLIAAERTGRICYGIELDPLYVDTIIRRWQKFTGLSATHAASSRSFNDLEKEAIDAARR